MYPPYVVFHVIHTTEESAAFFTIGPRPLTFDAWVVLGLMTCTVLLRREPTRDGQFGRITNFGTCLYRLLLSYRYAGSFRLRATIHSAEEMFGMAVVVLAQIAATGKDGS